MVKNNHREAATWGVTVALETLTSNGCLHEKDVRHLSHGERESLIRLARKEQGIQLLLPEKESRMEDMFYEEDY